MHTLNEYGKYVRIHHGQLEQNYADYLMDRFCDVVGEKVLGAEFYEFHTGEAALDALVLELFYTTKE